MRGCRTLSLLIGLVGALVMLACGPASAPAAPSSARPTLRQPRPGGARRRRAGRPGDGPLRGATRSAQADLSLPGASPHCRSLPRGMLAFSSAMGSTSRRSSSPRTAPWPPWRLATFTTWGASARPRSLPPPSGSRCARCGSRRPVRPTRSSPAEDPDARGAAGQADGRARPGRHGRGRHGHGPQALRARPGATWRLPSSRATR